MGAGDCCAKVVIILVNILFLILGLVLAAAGAILIGGRTLISPYLQAVLDSLNSVSGTSNLDAAGAASDTVSTAADILDLFQDVAISLIVVGLVILVVTILGMCGSCCSVKVMLIAYVVIVLVVFLAHLIVFLCLVFGVFASQIKGALVTLLEKEYGGIQSTTPQSLLLNFLMIRYQCCGLDGYQDFNNAEKWEREQTFTYSGVSVTRTLVTPIACCVTEGEFPNVQPVDEECSYLPTDINNNWKTGCWGALETELVDPNKNIVIGANCGVLVLELILAALTIFVLVMKDKSRVNVV